jgi:hypothetical protein
VPRRTRTPFGIARALFVALLSTASSPGCGTLSYVGRAEIAYDDGRYLEVAEDLARRETDLDNLSADKRVRYGVYRGLALLRLGDVDEAKRWLGYARNMQDKAPAALDDKQRSQLAEGWSALVRVGAVP